MAKELSIIISNYKRLEYIRRTLFSIAINPPKCDYEVVIADEISDQSENILAELRLYDARFSWKLVSCDVSILEKAVGRQKFFNNPSWTNNIAFKQCVGNLICLVGNDMIICKDTLVNMINKARMTSANHEFFTIYSKTLDCPKNIQESMGPLGANLNNNMIAYCEQWPLQSPNVRAMVTNYCSLSNRNTWEATKGYDENYVFTHGCEDSDFSLRARTLSNYTDLYVNDISLHQNHEGRTAYQEQNQSIITNEKWDEGLKLGRAYLSQWDGKNPVNRQSWEPGTIGITKVIKNAY